MQSSKVSKTPLYKNVDKTIKHFRFYMFLLLFMELIVLHKTRMTFIKAKLKKSDDLKNIDKYRVAANITEYYINSKSIIILKFMMTRQLFHV